jgi:hypothetical protein
VQLFILLQVHLQALQGFTNNINTTIFQQTPSYNAQGNNTNRLLIGLKQNPSTGISTISVCDPTTAPFQTGPGAFPGFINRRNTFSLTDGKIYIYINPWNQEPFTTTQSQITIRYQIAYRANSSSSWTTAVDLNGDTVDFKGSWIYDTSGDAGLTSGSLSSQIPEISLSKIENNTTRRYAGLVYAFGQVGEYRILHANYITTFGTFTSTQFPAPGFSCSFGSPPYSSSNTASYIEYGDFNYPATTAGGPDENIGPASGGLSAVFRYQIATSNNCSNAFTPNGTNYYAREPLAKYVTQLYTDNSLTTKYTFFNN